MTNHSQIFIDVSSSSHRPASQIDWVFCWHHLLSF